METDAEVARYAANISYWALQVSLFAIAISIITPFLELRRWLREGHRFDIDAIIYENVADLDSKTGTYEFKKFQLNCMVMHIGSAKTTLFGVYILEYKSRFHSLFKIAPRKLNLLLTSARHSSDTVRLPAIIPPGDAWMFQATLDALLHNKASRNLIYAGIHHSGHRRLKKSKIKSQAAQRSS